MNASELLVLKLGATAHAPSIMHRTPGTAVWHAIGSDPVA